MVSHYQRETFTLKEAEITANVEMDGIRKGCGNNTKLDWTQRIEK
jgi:hypothetical protein